MRTTTDDDDFALKELADAEDAEELCRLLLRSLWGWGSSTRHAEAIDLLRRMHGTGELAESLLPLLLCACSRWNRVTAKVIAAIEDSDLLSDSALDDLAQSFLSDEMVVAYPLAWVHPQWMEIDLTDGTSERITVDDDTLAEVSLHPEPPLRRWAAARMLRKERGRLEELLAAAARLEPRHHAALIHGLLDAADFLELDERRRLVQRGLRVGQGRVRRSALDRLCELDGPRAALQRARSDPDATVQKWRPATAQIDWQGQLT